MNIRTKFLTIGIIGIICIASFLALSFVVFPGLQSSITQISGDERERQPEVTNITVIVDYSGVKENEIYMNLTLTNYSTTAYHAILMCCEIKVQDYSWAIYVEEINGVGTGWTYTVNDEPLPNIPVDYFYLLDNDTVKWTHIR
jgi:hypothetical protein